MPKFGVHSWLIRTMVFLVLSTTAARAQSDRPAVRVTLLGQGKARVEQVIPASLVCGTNWVCISNAPALIDLASVQVGSAESVGAVRLLAAELPTAGSSDHLELRCRVDSTRAGPGLLAITFQMWGLDIAGHHTIQILPGGDEGTLDTSVCIHNRSGMSLNAVALEMPGMAWESSAAHPITVGNGESVYLPLRHLPRIRVGIETVYDGVVVDRFPRNPRTDWTYGTVARRTAEHRLVAPAGSAWVTNLSAGLLRVVRERSDGSVEFLGERAIAAQSDAARLQVPLGTAAGVEAVRERLGYSEVEAGHIYEESFEIRLSNADDDPLTLHVVEHLYRGGDFKIVAADTEYRESGERAIEFKPVLKPAGKSVIRYTVRYQW